MTRRIAVFRALQLGDMLCAVPALRALRAGEPDAHITLIGMPWAATFVQRFAQYVDAFMAFPGAPGLVEQSYDDAQLETFFAQARAQDFDLAIQLHGSGLQTNALVRELHAGTTAGCTEPGAASLDYTIPWSTTLSESARLLEVMLSLGYPDQGLALEFPISVAEADEAEAVLRRHRVPDAGYICVHPGARLLSRRWPVERFAAVARALADSGMTVVVTGASAEQNVIESFGRALDRPYINLCGVTSLGSLAVVIARARLLISNDTGVSHVAAAVGTASVIVACGSEVARWAPLDDTRHRVLASHPACRPCMFDRCPYDHACATAIAPEQVVATAHTLLEREAHAD